jgi:hypothetical protein
VHELAQILSFTSAFHFYAWVMDSVFQFKKLKSTSSEDMKAGFIYRCFCTYFDLSQICF